MKQFFIEGGFGMFPVLLVALVLLGAAIRYLIDGEPVRLRFLIALSLAQVVLMTHAVVANVAAVFHGVSHSPPDQRTAMLMVGFKESTRPALLGLALLALALILVAVGVYRVGRRELRAATGR